MFWVLGLAGAATAWLNSATVGASDWLNTRIFGSPNSNTYQAGDAYFDKQKGRWVIPVAPSGTDWGGLIKLALYIGIGLVALKALRELKWLIK